VVIKFKADFTKRTSLVGVNLVELAVLWCSAWKDRGLDLGNAEKYCSVFTESSFLDHKLVGHLPIFNGSSFPRKMEYL
jgi:hypothetical protein